MTGIDALGDVLLPDRARRGRVAGVAIGVVTDINDPEHLGRVRLKLPWLADGTSSPAPTTDWARVAAPMAGPERGVCFLPEVDDEVLVAFEHGAIERPVVVGALWNGRDKPPARPEEGKKNVNLIKSRGGLTVKLDDSEGAAKITIADRDGKNTIEIDSGKGTVSIVAEQDLIIKAKGRIAIESSGGDVSIKGANVQIDGRQECAIQAGTRGKIAAVAGLAITSSAGVNVNNGALEVI